MRALNFNRVSNCRPRQSFRKTRHCPLLPVGTANGPVRGAPRRRAPRDAGTDEAFDILTFDVKNNKLVFLPLVPTAESNDARHGVGEGEEIEKVAGQSHERHTGLTRRVGVESRNGGGLSIETQSSAGKPRSIDPWDR